MELLKKSFCFSFLWVSCLQVGWAVEPLIFSKDDVLFKSFDNLRQGRELTKIIDSLARGASRQIKILILEDKKMPETLLLVVKDLAVYPHVLIFTSAPEIQGRKSYPTKMDLDYSRPGFDAGTEVRFDLIIGAPNMLCNDGDENSVCAGGLTKETMVPFLKSIHNLLNRKNPLSLAVLDGQCSRTWFKSEPWLQYFAFADPGSTVPEERVDAVFVLGDENLGLVPFLESLGSL